MKMIPMQEIKNEEIILMNVLKWLIMYLYLKQEKKVGLYLEIGIIVIVLIVHHVIEMWVAQESLV